MTFFSRDQEQQRLAKLEGWVAAELAEHLFDWSFWRHLSMPRVAYELGEDRDYEAVGEDIDSEMVLIRRVSDGQLYEVEPEVMMRPIKRLTPEQLAARGEDT